MKLRDLLLPFGVIVTLAAALAVYYIYHKPLTAESVTHLLGVFADLGVALWLTILAGGLGQHLLSTFQLILNHQSSNNHLGLSAVLGFGVLGLVTLLLGLLGLINVWLIVGLLLILTVWLWRELRRWARAAGLGLVQLGQGGAFNRFCAVLVWWALALGLAQALAPPLRWDALTYHLNLPKWYAELGYLRVDANYIFTGMPQLNEMLFTLALILRNEQAAQTLGWCFGAVLALALAQFAAEALSPEHPALAPAILFSSLTIAVSLAWAYAEMWMMLCAVALLVSLREWAHTQSGRWLAVAGVCAGLAMGGKYTGVIVPLGAVGFFLAVASTPFFSRAKALVIFGLVTCLTFSPWLIKNALFTGNPFYPLIFPTETMEAARLWFYNRPDRLNRDVFVALTIFPRAVFFGAQSQNEYDATLGPIWALWPFWLVFGWRRMVNERRRTLWPLVAFCGVAYAGWVALMFISQYAIQARLFFALFPALAVLAVAGQMALQKLDTAQLRISFIARAVLSVVLVVSALETTLAAARLNPLPYLFGVQSASHYREQNLGGYEVVMRDINALPDNARVKFLWEAWGLGCKNYTRCMPDMIIDGWFITRQRLGSASNILAEWRKQALTHVLIFETGRDFVLADRDFNVYTAEDWQALENLRTRLILVKQYGDVYSLYALP